MGKGRYGGGGFGGGNNMQQMMRQAQKMQESMVKAQQEVEAKEVEASAGGGVVVAKVNGKKELLELTIKPEAVDPEDVEMLQDLIVAAVNEALTEAGELMTTEMNKITGGVNLGGLI